METALGRDNLKTLYILQILMERTDEEHPLNATDIGEILRSDYGIEPNRRTIYTEVEKLEAYGLDIVQLDGKRAGYYVASREFELPELKLLVDAVQSSRFITEKKSRVLIRKLETLCSREEAKQLSGQVVVYGRPKTENETIYYNVDMLHSAIFRDRQITFRYADWNVQKKMVLRHGGALYRVSPRHLLWDDENYYLIGFDENAQAVKHFRVDKMLDMSILEDARSSSSALLDRIDPASFSKKTFGMFAGEDEQIRLRCTNALAGVVIDQFGTDIWMRPDGPDHFLAQVTVSVSRQFFGWVTAIGKDMKIVGPESVKDQYAEYLRGILESCSAE